MAVTARMVNSVVNLVEEPVCKCRIKLISYQLDQLASDLFFCLCISNLFTSGNTCFVIGTIMVMNSQKFETTSY